MIEQQPVYLVCEVFGFLTARFRARDGIVGADTRTRRNDVKRRREPDAQVHGQVLDRHGTVADSVLAVEQIGARTRHDDHVRGIAQADRGRLDRAAQ